MFAHCFHSTRPRNSRTRPFRALCAACKRVIRLTRSSRVGSRPRLPSSDRVRRTLRSASCNSRFSSATARSISSQRACCLARFACSRRRRSSRAATNRSSLFVWATSTRATKSATSIAEDVRTSSAHSAWGRFQRTVRSSVSLEPLRVSSVLTSSPSFSSRSEAVC